jgi:hypothetical protein
MFDCIASCGWGATLYQTFPPPEAYRFASGERRCRAFGPKQKCPRLAGEAGRKGDSAGHGRGFGLRKYRHVVFEVVGADALSETKLLAAYPKRKQPFEENGMTD